MNKYSQEAHKRSEVFQAGFSLVEVLIGLVLSGLLMSMVSMVLGQSITNNEVVRSSAGQSSRMFTMRRLLHRDFQNRVIGGSITVKEDGFGIGTANNFLLDGGSPVEAVWDFSGNMIRRHETREDIKYDKSFQLVSGIRSWQLELLDRKDGVWVSAIQNKGRGITLESVIKAVRLNLVFEDGQRVLIVERVPYVFE